MQPQIPRQGFMGRPQPGLFGGRPPTGPGLGGRTPMGMNQPPRAPMMGMNRTPRAPFMGMGGAQQMNRGGGGLFSRLFGMGNQTGRMGLMGMQQAGRAAGAGGPGGVMNFLNNTQQFLRTAQSIGPMVQQFQQYAPLVKNLPAMWKIYRGLKSTSDDTESNEKSSSKTAKNSLSKNSSKKSNSRAVRRDESSSKTRDAKSAAQLKTSSSHVTWKKQTNQAKSQKGSSTPKLYI